jgi:hypothetical protein
MCNTIGTCRYRKSVASCDRWSTYKGGQINPLSCIWFSVVSNLVLIIAHSVHTSYKYSWKRKDGGGQGDKHLWMNTAMRTNVVGNGQEMKSGCRWAVNLFEVQQLRHVSPH